MNGACRQLAVGCGLGLCLAVLDVLTRSECGDGLWTSANGFLECASLGAGRMPDLNKGACILLSFGFLTSVWTWFFFGDRTDASKQGPELSQGKERDGGVGP